MGKSKVVAAVAGILVVACVAFVVVLLLVKLLWAWTIPDLFPGAVKGDTPLVAPAIGWLTAVKVALFVAVLSAFAHGGHRK